MKSNTHSRPSYMSSLQSLLGASEVSLAAGITQKRETLVSNIKEAEKNRVHESEMLRRDMERREENRRAGEFIFTHYSLSAAQRLEALRKEREEEERGKKKLH